MLEHGNLAYPSVQPHKTRTIKIWVSRSIVMQYLFLTKCQQTLDFNNHLICVVDIKKYVIEYVQLTDVLKMFRKQ